MRKKPRYKNINDYIAGRKDLYCELEEKNMSPFHFIKMQEREEENKREIERLKKIIKNGGKNGEEKGQKT